MSKASKIGRVVGEQVVDAKNQHRSNYVGIVDLLTGDIYFSYQFNQLG